MSIGNHWNHIHNPTETGEEGKLPDFYRIFSDDMIQGKEYTLNVYRRYKAFYRFNRRSGNREAVKVH
jgi:hypothetical protein